MTARAKSATTTPITHWTSLKAFEGIDPGFQSICETYRGVCARLAALRESKHQPSAVEIEMLRRRRGQLMAEIVDQW